MPGVRPQVADISLIQRLGAALRDESLPLSRRFRALFGLKHHASLQPPSPLTEPAIAAIASALESCPSALLKHEVAYCLGQTRHEAAIPPLRKTLSTKHEDPMVRHEAAEALGAIGDSRSLELLEQRRDDADEETVVRETCDIAVERIRWEVAQRREKSGGGREGGVGGEILKKSDFASIDPAPPMPDFVPTEKDSDPIPALRRTLLDPALPLFLRYRAMFGLRDLASPPDLATAVPAVEALAEGFGDSSALFRHEIAFVFGQLSHPTSIPALRRTLEDRSEVGMVRHEAAEALGGLGEHDGVEEFLRRFVGDEERIVRESVVVALDMAEFEKSGEMEYAVLPEEVVGQA